MKLFSFRNGKTSQNGEVSTPAAPQCLCDQGTGLYIEGYFRDLLCLERKRTERSRRPFVLMHLDMTRALQGPCPWDTDRMIAEVLFSCTRETDIKGWHTRGRVIGVVFTEVDKVDIVTLQEKISSQLVVALGPEIVRNLEFAFHLFPDEVNGDGPDGTNGNRNGNGIYPDLYRPRREESRGGTMAKRALDIAGSIAALALFAPVFVIVPLLIKLTSAGPVLFRQHRVGQYGKHFGFLKFRTMYVNNDESIHKEYVRTLIREQKAHGKDGTEGRAVFKIKDDPRVTPLGRFLRKTSLDEFPQFLNVLKGDMSMVGPRPPIPYEMENYDIWHRRRVLEVKPGITGLWQVYGRSKTNFDEMVRLDLRYVREQSLWLDLKIILQTPWVVITGKGAY